MGLAMPPGQHDNPSPASPPSRPENPAADGTTSAPDVLGAPVMGIWIHSRITRIGRHPDNDIIIRHPGVSEQHVELRRSLPGPYRIVDLGSRNGTYVNGTRVTQQELAEGDIITIGDAVTFQLSGSRLIQYLNDASSPG